jgi:hypothetical protein
LAVAFEPSVSCVHARTALALSLVAISAFNPLFPPFAQARTVDPRELEARRDFAEARYEDALHIFAQLFSEAGDPIYLRNLARCYQKLKRPAEAIAGFQDYLVKGNLAPGEREEIGSYIAEMRALQSEQRAPAVAPNEISKPTGSAPVEASRAPKPASQLVAPLPAPRGPVTPPAPADTGNRRLLRVTALAAGAAGVVLLGVGVGYGMAAHSAQSEVEYQYDPARDAEGGHYERLQWIAYAAGGVALATGVGLLIASLRGPETAERSESHALVGPRGLAWEATF